MLTPHIELIDPKERLSPELGGTGYVGPRGAANVLDLFRSASAAFEQWPHLNAVVWKVLRSSVNWKKHANTRRLVVDGRRLDCTVIGGTMDWWFVSLEASRVVDALTVR